MAKITVVCRWCGKKLAEDQGVEGESPGICDQCLNRYFPHQADNIRAALEVENIEEIYGERR